MSTTNNVTTNYVGKVAQGYLTRALKSGDTLDQNLVAVKTGLKEKGITMRRIDASSLLQDATCAFTPSGQLDLDFRVLTGKKLEVNLEPCWDDFEGAWEAEDMGESAHDNVSAPYREAILKFIAGKIGEANDSLIWTGEDTTNEYEGFLQKLAGDSDLPANQNITGTTITASNVAAEIGKVVDAIPDAVFNLDSDLVIVCSSDIGRKYMRALAGFGSSGEGGAGYMNMGFVGRKPLDFEGIPMFIVGGLPTGTMLAYKVENLAFGTGALADWTRVKVLDMRDVTGDDTMRIIMKMYAGVQYGFVDEIVAYNLPAAS
jgi:hypothetical protein